MLRELKKNFQEAKAEFSGQAISRARLVLNGNHVPGLEPLLGQGPQVVVPLRGAIVRMMDGDPMQYHTDGSIRHALGKPDKKERRRRKKKLREMRARAK